LGGTQDPGIWWHGKKKLHAGNVIPNNLEITQWYKSRILLILVGAGVGSVKVRLS
jgi:hypothetical protein